MFSHRLTQKRRDRKEFEGQLLKHFPTKIIGAISDRLQIKISIFNFSFFFVDAGVTSVVAFVAVVVDDAVVVPVVVVVAVDVDEVVAAQ